MKKFDPTILVLTQLPPPHHGMSSLNKALVDNLRQELDSRIRVVVVDISLNKLPWKKKFASLLTLPFKAFFVRPDVVYITPSFRWPIMLRDILLVLSCRIVKAKIYIQIHDGIVYRLSGSRIMRLLLTPFFSGNQVLVSNKNTERLIIGAWPNLAGSKVVHNGVRFFSDNTLGFKFHNVFKSRFVLYLSRLEKKKGIFALLNNLDQILLEGHKLVCAGAVEQKVWAEIQSRYKSFIDKGDVLFLGQVTENEKYWLLDNCQFLVYPTALDDLPLVLIEALQRGCPIISSNVGGIGCLEPGKIVLYNGEEGLREAIKKVLLDPNFSDKDLEAAAVVREKYSLENYTNSVIECLRYAFKN
jgi:glycosyltransferase involved in cell wall biosynthesis